MSTRTLWIVIVGRRIVEPNKNILGFGGPESQVLTVTTVNADKQPSVPLWMDLRPILRRVIAGRVIAATTIPAYFVSVTMLMSWSAYNGNSR